jgi:uncharacterized lipoprotein YmbA
LPGSAADPPAAASFTLGLGPITLPGYLEHPMLATRVNGTEIRYADFDRWAEPLPSLFARTLGHQLATLVGARIVRYPWYRATPLDAVVRVDVSSFEVDDAGNARLAACWSIRDSRSTTVQREACASVTEAVGEPSRHAEVAALGRAVEELARRVARAIRS